MNRVTWIVFSAACMAAGLCHIVRSDDSTGRTTERSKGSDHARPDWVRTGESRYGWKWLVDHYDKDGDGTVVPAELPLSSDAFTRLDRTWDGVLTSDDFNWSKEGALCRQKETTFALFKFVDSSSDGRITPEEWQTMFAKLAGEKGYLNEEELEQLVYQPNVVKTAKQDKLRTSDSEFSPERQKTRNEVPKPGEVAPDFELRSPDGLTTVRLSSFRGKRPVVLVFGCFSCGNYRTYSQSLEKLYERMKDDVAFVRVYVREAHPVSDNVSATSTNAIAGILIKQPTTTDERCDVAQRFVSTLNLKTPLVVDGIDNRVGQLYGAWPDRLYVVDREGRIAFTGGPGPFGFNPREMEQTLLMLQLDQKQDSSTAK